MRSVRFGCAVTVAVVALGLFAPGMAVAQASKGAFPSCLTHALTVTPGAQLEVDTYIDNQCGFPISLNVTYRAIGPCPHALNIPLTAPKVPIDLVTFFNGPCAGHYQMRQRVSAGPQRFGEDIVQFDMPQG